MNTRHDVYRFIYHGRQYQIYRRVPQGSFYIRRKLPGESNSREKSLDTPIRAVAIRAARAWLDAALDAARTGKWDSLDALRSRSEYCTIAQVVDRYESRAAGAANISPASVGHNVSTLLSMLRTVTASDPRPLRSDILSESTIRAFIEAARVAGRSENGIRSALVKSRSLFQPGLLYIYDGLKLPDLSGFRVVVKTKAEDTRFRPLDPDQFRRMESDAESLPAPVRTCYLLMSRLGLRNKEVAAARRHWIELRTDGARYLCIRNRPEEAFTTKTGQSRNLRIPETLWTLLNSSAGHDYLVEAPDKTARRIAICNDAINAFVSHYFPERKKKSYELRKHAGSLVYTQHGAEAARKFLGHSSITTTESHYAEFLHPVSGVDADHLASVYG